MNEITVTAQRRNQPSRWIRLTLALRHRPAGEPFVRYAPGYRCSVDPDDQRAGSNNASIWESGILSGVGYAWRRWMSDGQGLLLKELTGRLAGDDVEGVAAAAHMATATMLGREYLPGAHRDWELAVGSQTNGAPASPSSAPLTGPVSSPQ